ncbi:APC family permease [Acidaminobacter sp. JC074]|uniref:APC family permease n=1 Tax=Acidaminobacter sp. JC074 TaxID=2530199 RepID=UPI001F0D947B|nr:APC family permease [Acidaminobacter sp. JC074]MCH4886525.1 APC family permease [Acidaminobacter sp. JC074]
MNKKIGPLLLSGLMIGPILGSGIVLLPPIAYKMLGDWSLIAWIFIMFLGALFALCFSKLSILLPGDGGMTLAIDQVMGPKWKLYASFLMISAVSVGPTAVMLTAGEYLNQLGFLSNISQPIIAMVLIVVSFFVLLRDLKVMSTISFIVSTCITLILLLSSVATIATNGIHFNSEPVTVMSFGKTSLLLFWAIIGWEIVGNYSGQVKDVKTTVKRATIISIIVITLTYILIALSFNSIGNEGMTLTQILYPVFKTFSPSILAILVTGLCMSTYILIVGALSRLVSSIATEGYLPKLLMARNKHNIPTTPTYYFIIMHLIILTLNQLHLIDIESVVSFANGFFVLNAIIGLVSVYKISGDVFLKGASILLIIGLSILLIFSSLTSIILMLIVYLIALFLYRSKSLI